jgi:hypothetical protein
MNTLSGMAMVLVIVGLTGLTALAADTPKDTPAVSIRGGVVVKVAEDGSSLTMTVGRGTRAKEVVVNVDEKAVIIINGKEGGKVTDLKPGTRVAVSPAEGKATRIDAMAPVGDREPVPPPPPPGANP